MEQKNQDMTSGSLAKGILFFSIPLMLSNILQVLFNMSDIAVVGHFAGCHGVGICGFYHDPGHHVYRIPDWFVWGNQRAGGIVLWGEK